MIIRYSDTNENRIYWQHRRGEEWKTAELHELIGAYERATEPGDLISRQATIQAIDDYTKGKPLYEYPWQLIEVIRNVPSAEKTGKWIPVSERLPEEDTEVLICYKYREGEGDTNHARIDITSYGDMYFGGNRIAQTKHWRQPFEYFALNYEVVAWMPFPEPYKEQTNCGARMVD